MHTLFQTIDSYLLHHQAYWRFEPFFASQNEQLPWQSLNPALCAWLEQLSDHQIEHYQSDFAALVQDCLAFFTDLKDFQQLLALDEVSRGGLTLERGIDSGVPGRKLEQIVAMGESALQLNAGEEWLEWCSGKGFLGRILASQSGQKVTSFEFQQSLCDAGQTEADKQGLAMHFVQGDAFSPEAKLVFNPKQHAVALHACGDLHVTLLKHAVGQQLPALTVSPCCYHLINSTHYQCMSHVGKQSKLHLTKAELRIPLQELVTGGERVKRHRLQEMSFRLAFDIMLREQGVQDSYIPIPSIKKSQLGDGFTAFCHWASEQKAIELPNCDFELYLEKGIKRFWRMERLGLVQQLFRRGLEMWLVLDKASYLQDSGYSVTIRDFCAREVTPRNILLQATKI